MLKKKPFQALAGIVLGMSFITNAFSSSLRFYQLLFLAVGIGIVLGTIIGLQLYIIGLLEKKDKGAED